MNLSSGKSVAVAASLLFLAFLCSGCARMTTVLRKYDSSKQSIAIDAKQRVILSGAPKAVDATRTVPVICAEPSPDALSALAASNGLSFSKQDKLDIASNFALSESAGSIGLRTQSIQLMRDAMYRLCEGYLSGAINEIGFETLHRRFQSSMVAILAIEQLTGAVKAPAIALTGSAVVGSAELVAKYTEETDKAKRALPAAKQKADAAQLAADKAKTDREALETEAKTLETKLAGVDLNNPPADKKTDAERSKALTNTLIPAAKTTETTKGGELETAKSAYENLQASIDYYDSARKAAMAGGGKTSTSAVITTLPDTQRSDAAMKEVAAAVKDIVSQTLGLNFTRELCTSVLARNASQAVKDEDKTAISACHKYLLASVAFSEEASRQLNLLTNDLEEADTEAKKTAIREQQKILNETIRLGPDGKGGGVQMQPQ